MKKMMPASLLAVLMAGAASNAMAQTSDERIAAMEAKIAALTGELASLKTATTKADQEIRKDVATVQTTQTTLSSARPTIASADGTQKFAVRSVVQFDAASYNEKSGPDDLNSGTNFRRARLGVEGAFAKDWNYYVTAEFGGSGQEATLLNQAYIEYTGFKPFGPKTALRLRIGGWATPTGLEDATSNTEALFLERPAVAEIVRNLAGGDGRSGVGGIANGGRWYASAVLTGGVVAAQGATPEYDEQQGFLTRVAFNPLGGKDYGLHVGANIQGVLRPADTAAGAATVTQVRLRERPELRVDGTRLVDTGNIKANGVTAYGGELGIFYKNLQVSAEAFKIDVDRIGAYDLTFGGWYVQGAWTITGETHAWSSANGGFKGIKPRHAFNPAKKTWGAWELAARYSVLDLNDHAGEAGATPAGGIRGGEQEIATVGLNWYPNSVFRFQLQYQHVNVDRLNATGTQVGEDVDIISARSQFAF